MKEVEFFNFALPPDNWRKKPGPSSYKMTLEQAARQYPGAQPILSSREIRRIPETPEEMGMDSKYSLGTSWRPLD